MGNQAEPFSGSILLYLSQVNASRCGLAGFQATVHEVAMLIVHLTLVISRTREEPDVKVAT